MKWCSPSDYLPDKDSELRRLEGPRVFMVDHSQNMSRACEVIELIPIRPPADPRSAIVPRKSHAMVLLAGSAAFGLLSCLAALLGFFRHIGSFAPVELMIFFISFSAALILFFLGLRRSRPSP